MDKTPIYKDSFEYAYQHGEEEQHRASNHANIACKEAIEKAIASHYHDNCLDVKAAVRDVVKRFGYERILYVLANTVQAQGGDGRVSQSNKNGRSPFPLCLREADGILPTLSRALTPAFLICSSVRRGTNFC